MGHFGAVHREVVLLVVVPLVPLLCLGPPRMKTDPDDSTHRCQRLAESLDNRRWSAAGCRWTELDEDGAGVIGRSFLPGTRVVGIALRGRRAGLKPKWGWTHAGLKPK